MELEDAKKAVESPQSHYLQSRRLRVEYGSSEAVQRGTPWIHDPKGLHRKREHDEAAEADTAENKEETSGAAETETRPTRRRRRNVDAPPLAPPAPTRGPVAAVPFQGSKMTFDDNDD